MPDQLKGAQTAGKAVAIVALTGAVGYGIYALMRKEQKGVPSGFEIVSYQNLNTGVTVTIPNILEVSRGDTIKVTFHYSYYGPAVSGIYHLALWYPLLPFDPHKEKANIDVAFTLPETKEAFLFTASINIVCDIEAGSYGLYIKIMGLPGADIFTPYYPDVISVDGGGATDWLPANTELARTPFSVIIAESVWLPANTELARSIFSVDIIPSAWLPANTELARAYFSVTIIAAQYYTLTLKAYPGIWAGYIAQEPEMDQYPYGFIVKLTAVPIFPYNFGYWLVDDEQITGNPINFLVINDHVITAVFY